MLKYRDISGKLHRESSKSRLKSVAEKMLREREVKKDQGILMTPEVGPRTSSKRASPST